MYVITGATGHTGSITAEKLLGGKEKVRVIGRDKRKLERFLSKGAEVFVGDVTDEKSMEKAFSGASAVYAMIPPNPVSPDPRAYQERVSDALTAAIKKNKVAHAVVLSSIGADKSSGTGPVVGLHNFEKKIESIDGLNVVFLRAGYFMENLLAQVAIIPALGSMAGPIRADLALTMIATRDIGTAVAELLAKLDFSGKQTRELLGARDVTYTEATKAIATAIGKPDLTYRQPPAAQIKPALIQAGMSSAMADQILEMAEALNSGYMKALETRSAKNTTATTIETFATEVFAPTFRGRAAGA